MTPPILRGIALRCAEWSAQQCAASPAKVVPLNAKAFTSLSFSQGTSSFPQCANENTSLTSSKSSSSPCSSSSFLPSHAATTIQCLAVSTIALWSLVDPLTKRSSSKKKREELLRNEHSALTSSSSPSVRSSLSVSKKNVEDHSFRTESSEIFFMTLAEQMTKDTVFFLEHFPVGAVVPMDTLTILLQLLRRLTITYRNKRQEALHYSSLSLFSSSSSSFSSPSIFPLSPCEYQSWIGVMEKLLVDTSIAITTRANRRTLLLWPTSSAFTAVNTITSTLETFTFPSRLLSDASIPASSLEVTEGRENPGGQAKMLACQRCNAESRKKVECDEIKPQEKDKRETQMYAATAALLQLADDIILSLHELRLFQMGDEEMILFMEHLAFYRQQQRRFSLFYSSTTSAPSYSNQFTADKPSAGGERVACISSSTSREPTSHASPLLSSPLSHTSPPLVLSHSPPFPFLCVRPTPRAVVWEAVCKCCCSIVQRVKSPASQHRLARAVIAGDDFHFCPSHVVPFPPPSCGVSSSNNSCRSSDTHPADEKETEEQKGREMCSTVPVPRKEQASGFYVQKEVPLSLFGMSATPGPHQQYLMRALILLRQNSNLSTTTTTSSAHHPSHHPLPTAYPALHDRLSSVVHFHTGVSFSSLVQHLLQLSERMIHEFLYASHRFRRQGECVSLFPSNDKDVHSSTRGRPRRADDCIRSGESRIVQKIEMWCEDHQTNHAATYPSPSSSAARHTAATLSTPFQEVAEEDVNSEEEDEEEEEEARVVRMIQKRSEVDEDEVAEVSEADGANGFLWRKNQKKMEEVTEEEEEREIMWKDFSKRPERKEKRYGSRAARRSFSSSSPATQVDFLFSPSTTMAMAGGSRGAADGGHASAIHGSVQKGAGQHERREGMHLLSAKSVDASFQEVVHLLHRLRKVSLTPPQRGKHDADGWMEKSATGKESTRGQREIPTDFTIQEGLPLLLCYTAMRHLLWEDEGKDAEVENRKIEVEGETGSSRRDSHHSDRLPVIAFSVARLSAAWNPFWVDVLKTNLLWLAQRILAPPSLSSSSSLTFLPSRYFVVLSLLMGEHMAAFVAVRPQQKTIRNANNGLEVSASPLTAERKEEEKEKKKAIKDAEENKESSETEEGVEEDQLVAIREAYGIVLRAFLQEEKRSHTQSTSSSSSTFLSDSSPLKAKGARLWALMLGSCVLRTLESGTTASPSAPVSPALRLCDEVDQTCATVFQDWQRVAGLFPLLSPLPFGEGTMNASAYSSVMHMKANGKGEGNTEERERKKPENQPVSSFLSSQECAASSSPPLLHSVSSTAHEAAYASLELLQVMAIFWPVIGTGSMATRGVAFPSFSSSSSSYMVAPSVVAALLRSPTLSRQLHPNALLESVVVLSTLQTKPWWRWAVGKRSSTCQGGGRCPSTSPSTTTSSRRTTAFPASPTPTPFAPFADYVAPFIQVHEHLLALLTGYPEVEKHVRSLRTLLLPLTCSPERMSTLSHDSTIAAATAAIGRGTAEVGWDFSHSLRSGPSMLLDMATRALQEVRGGGGSLGKWWTVEELEKRFRAASPSVWAPPSLPPLEMTAEPLALVRHSLSLIVPCTTAPLPSMSSSMRVMRENCAAVGVGSESTTATDSTVSSFSPPSLTSPLPLIGSSSSTLSLPSYLPDPILDIYVRWLLFNGRRQSSHPETMAICEPNTSKQTTTTPTKEEDCQETTDQHDGNTRTSTPAVPLPFGTVRPSSSPSPSPPSPAFAVIAPADTVVLLSFFEERRRDATALAKAFQILFTRRLGQSAPLLSRLSSSRFIAAPTEENHERKEEAKSTSDAFNALVLRRPLDRRGNGACTNVILPVFSLLRLLNLLTVLYECKEISYRSIAHRLFELLSSSASLHQCESIPDLFPLAAVLSEPLCVAVRCGPLLAKAIQQRATFLASTVLSILDCENGEKQRSCSLSFVEKGSQNSGEKNGESVRKQWDTHSRKPQASWGDSACLTAGGTARDKGLLVAYIIRAEMKVDEEMLRVFRVLTLREKNVL